MRIRTSLFSLAVLALAVVPLAAETPPPMTQTSAASISPTVERAAPESVSTTLVTEIRMSWGRSAKGTANEVREQIKDWANAVEQAARTYASEDVTRLHKAQVEKCVEATERFIDAVPDGYDIDVKVGGHAHATPSDVGADQWYVNLGAMKPATVASV